MALPTVDLDVITLLDAELAWVIATTGATMNASAGPVRHDLPRPSIFAESYSGTRFDHTDGALRDISVQVTVLGVRDGYAAARARASEAWEVLDRRGRWVGGSGAVYYDAICEGAGPIPLGLEDDDSPRFSFTVTVSFADDD
jgi:hypothetical protein